MQDLQAPGRPGGHADRAPGAAAGVARGGAVHDQLRARGRAAQAQRHEAGVVADAQPHRGALAQLLDAHDQVPGAVAVELGQGGGAGRARAGGAQCRGRVGQGGGGALDEPPVAQGQGARRGQGVDPAAGGDGGLVVLAGVAGPPGQQHGPRLAGAPGEGLRGVELEAPVDLAHGAVALAQLGAHQAPDGVDAGEDVLVALLPGRPGALGAPDEHVALEAGGLVGQGDQARALPHEAEVVQGPAGVGEGDLPGRLPGQQVARAVEHGRARLVGALDPDEHAVGAGALGVARHLRVAVVGGVTGGVVGDERVGGPLGEVVQVRGGDQALAGRALVGDGVLEVARVEQLVGGPRRGGPGLRPGQDEGAAGVGARGVVGAVRDDGHPAVAPVQQVRGAGVAPVDQAAGPVQGGELVEGVVGPGVDEQPVGVVEPAHGRGDVHERVVGVLPRPGGGDRVVGQCPQVLSHAARLTGPGPLAGLDGGAILRRARQWK